MLYLDDNKDYYILIDGQGGWFGCNRIFEGLEEVMEQFRLWADNDEYEDATLKDWTLGDCLDNWTMIIKKYNGSDFVYILVEEYDYVSPKKPKESNDIEFYNKHIN